MRGTPWLGSRRGVVITSRSDRVPLLSRRHTLAEKQNGTSDRPTDRPFSLLSLILSSLAHPPSPGLFLSAHLPFSGRFSRDFDLDEIFLRNCRHVTEQREKRGCLNYKSHRHLKNKEERKRKGWRKNGGMRGRIVREESSTHLFQSSRGTRDSIREINDRRIGTILCRAPSGYETEPRFPSFRFEERRTRKGDSVSASGPQKRLGVPLIYERDSAPISVPREY